MHKQFIWMVLVLSACKLYVCVSVCVCSCAFACVSKSVTLVLFDCKINISSSIVWHFQKVSLFYFCISLCTFIIAHNIMWYILIGIIVRSTSDYKTRRNLLCYTMRVFTCDTSDIYTFVRNNIECNAATARAYILFSKYIEISMETILDKVTVYKMHMLLHLTLYGYEQCSTHTCTRAFVVDINLCLFSLIYWFCPFSDHRWYG